jgi:hypothetical protein
MISFITYSLTLLAAGLGLNARSRDAELQIIGATCSLIIYAAICLLRSAALGDDTLSYIKWAQEAYSANSFGELLGAPKDVGFGIILAWLSQLFGPEQAVLIALPFICAVLLAVNFRAITPAWPLALSLAVTSRLYWDYTFNGVRNTLAVLLVYLYVGSGAIRRWWLGVPLLAFVGTVHIKGLILTLLCFLAGAYFPRRLVLPTIILTNVISVVRSFIGFKILPTWLYAIPAFNQLADTSASAALVETGRFSFSLAIQVAVYITLPLAITAIWSRNKLSRREESLLATGVICLMLYAMFGAELGVGDRVLPIAFLIAITFLATLQTPAMYLARCLAFTTNLIALYRIAAAGEVSF